MIQKREMFARISKYFEECANHEVYVELMGKLNGFNSIFNFWYRSYERQEDKELCSELKDIKQLAEQLTELIQTYSNRHPKPKEEPSPLEISKFLSRKKGE